MKYSPPETGKMSYCSYVKKLLLALALFAPASAESSPRVSSPLRFGAAPPTRAADLLDGEYVRAGGVELERAGAIVEPRPGGWELSWFVETRPEGDLRIEQKFRSPHPARVIAGGVAWGGTVYRDAVTFDATGRRLRTELELEGDRVLVRVPARELADAKFPILVDPFLGAAFSIQDPTNDFFFTVPQSDVAHMTSNDRYFVAFNDDATGASEWRVRFSILSSAGATIVSPTTIDDPAGATDSIYGVRASYSPSSDRVLVVWVNQGAASTNVRGRIYNSDGSPFAAAFDVSDQGDAFTENWPGVTYEAADTWLVVWQHVLAEDGSGNATNMEIRMRRYSSATGAASGASAQAFAPATGTEMNYTPGIGSLPGTGSVLAYANAPTNASAGSVLSRFIPSGGSPGAASTISNGGQDAFRPSVRGDTNASQFLVAYQSFLASLTIGASTIDLVGEIGVRRTSSGGAPVGASAVTIAAADAFMPQVSFSTSTNQFLLTYGIVTGGLDLSAGGNANLAAARLDPSNDSVIESVTLDDGSVYDFYPAPGCRVGGEALISFHSTDASVTPRVRGVLFSLPASGGGGGGGGTSANPSEGENGNRGINDACFGSVRGSGGFWVLALALALAALAIRR